ncbi:MAG TPA: LysM peptidoglycan-binding domain-containing protein, partial [Candidatus Brocadiia bacterium]|nr:LysM peptidoglycan-binding domain-containing protein [Candidatus Brocadiia bacterium]
VPEVAAATPTPGASLLASPPAAIKDEAKASAPGPMVAAATETAPSGAVPLLISHTPGAATSDAEAPSAKTSAPKALADAFKKAIASSKTADAKAESKTDNVKVTLHRVQKGESLYSICRKLGLKAQREDLARIARDNSLSDPGAIRPGMVLRIPVSDPKKRT